MDITEKIREIAYSIWEGKGRPEGQHDDDWLEAERRYNEGVGLEPGNEGEGSYTAAKAYDEATTAFAQSGKVEPAAQSAAAALDDPAQAAEMERAEEVGKRHSHGEDPQLKAKS
jgi:hypothetical protein